MESVVDSLDDGDRAETSLSNERDVEFIEGSVEEWWRGLIQIFAVHARAGACTCWGLVGRPINARQELRPLPP